MTARRVMLFDDPARQHEFDQQIEHLYTHLDKIMDQSRKDMEEALVNNNSLRDSLSKLDVWVGGLFMLTIVQGFFIRSLLIRLDMWHPLQFFHVAWLFE